MKRSTSTKLPGSRAARCGRAPKRARNPLHQLRVVALLEGLSYVALLFVAMPLKYLAGMPLAVRIVGSVHGALFILFCAVLVRTSLARRWPLGRTLFAFVASIVPFGTFVLDRSLRREIADAGLS